MEIQHLIREADEKLDSNDFASARTCYREGLQCAEPTQPQLANLSLAEREEVVQFRRQLCSLFPKSNACRISLIQSLDAAGHFDAAQQFASECLLQERTSNQESLMFRLLRFSVSLSSRNHEFVIDDFRKVWREGEVNRGAFGLRRTVIFAISNAKSVSLAEKFEELSREDFIDQHMSQFLKLKSEQLRSLNAVLNLS